MRRSLSELENGPCETPKSTSYCVHTSFFYTHTIIVNGNFLWRMTSDKLREMKGLIGLLFSLETLFLLRKVTSIIISRSILNEIFLINYT